MSLEEALVAMTAAVEKNTQTLTTLLGVAAAKGSTVSGGGAAAGAAANEETVSGAVRERGKPSAGRARRTKEEVAEDEAADAADTAASGTGGKDEVASGPTFDQLKAALLEWLGEFSKDTDAENPDGIHPEVLARKEQIKALYTNPKLNVKALGEIAGDQTKIELLFNWLNGKAKTYDGGFGIGRFAPDPAPATTAATGGLDDL